MIEGMTQFGATLPYFIPIDLRLVIVSKIQIPFRSYQTILCNKNETWPIPPTLYHHHCPKTDSFSFFIRFAPLTGSHSTGFGFIHLIDAYIKVEFIYDNLSGRVICQIGN